MEMLKSCIADQLRTIQENEERAMDRVREGRHLLRKGEGIEKKMESLKRARSSPALRRNQQASLPFSVLLHCPPGVLEKARLD